MNGICGVIEIGTKKDKTGLLRQMEKMSNAIRHRISGKPDFYTSVTDKHSFAFGTSLSHNEDESIWVALDGEIYNYKELKKELEEKGYKFHTDKAGEAILCLYKDSGISNISKLDGNFAFVIWDLKKEKVLLVRDNFGIKPFYYWLNNSKLLFGTEMKAILTDESVERNTNDNIIYDFLVTGVHEHTEDTFFKGVKKVMPAECVTIDFSKGTLKIASKQRYWELKENTAIAKYPPQEIISYFYNLFEDAVKIRAVGKFGSMLSGGLDSSSVVGMLCKIRDYKTKPFPTFSSSHTDAYLDESKYISAVVDKWGLENKTILPESTQLWQDFEKFIWHQEEPIRGSSTWDHYSLLRFVSENDCKFLFDGQGGDETLFGYVGYFPRFLIELWHNKQVFRSLKEATKGASLLKTTLRDKVIGYISPQSALAFLNPDFTNKFKGHEKEIAQELFPETLKEKSFYAITKYSLAFLLKETERNAGAFGIELRTPFIDPRLVECSFSLPVEYKIREGWNKWILREIGKDLLPPLVRERKRKIGFGTPEARWARELSQEIKDIFKDDKQISKYVDVAKFLARFDELCKGKAIQPDFFWRVISLKFWLKKFSVK